MIGTALGNTVSARNTTLCQINKRTKETVVNIDSVATTHRPT